MPSKMAENIELLFFDTFSHETSEELNLDLVQFPKPVFISEVRIIPLGARVQADFPGGVRLGATNPSQFEIEFFVNDLSKPGASTFESLGGIDYKQNGNIHLACERRASTIPTDGLVLRGWYTTITLAVYGALTKVVVDHAAVAPPSSAANTETRSSPRADWSSEGTPRSDWPTEGVQYGPETQAAASEHYPGSGTTFDPTYLKQEYPATYPEQWNNQTQGTPGLLPPPEPYEPPNNQGGTKENWGDQQQQQDKSSWERKDWENSSSRGDWDRNSEWTQQQRGWRHSSQNRNRTWESDESTRKRPYTPPPSSEAKKWTKTSPEFHEKDEGYDGAADVESISSEGDIVEGEERREVATPPPPDTPSPPPRDSFTPQPSAISPTPQEEPEQFEPILSDEDNMEDLDAQFQDADFEDVEEPDTGFDPLLELKPLTFLCDPALSEGEVIVWRQQQQRVLTDQAVTNSDQVVTNSDLTNHITPPETTVPIKSSDVSPEESSGEVKSAEEVTKLTEMLNQGQNVNSEMWVDLCEQAVPLTIQVVPLKPELTGALVTWMARGLDINQAKAQPQPGYKVRHLKAGLRLALALCNCGQDVLNALLEVQLHQKLFNLFKEEHMALSLRLLSLRILDTLLRTAESTEIFLKSDGYSTLLDLLQEAKLARVQFALASLIRKIHLYDMLKLVQTLTSELTDDNVANIEKLSAALEEISNTLKDASLKTGQFRRFLPVKSQFDFPTHIQDPYLAIFAYVNHFSTLQSVLLVLTHPNTCDNLITPVLELLQFLLTTESGLRFLASNRQVTYSLIKILLIKNNDLGLKLAYYMRVISALDQLWSHHGKINSETNCLEPLRVLFCLGECLLGRLCTAHVLTRGDNIVPVISAIGSNRGALPGRSYAMDLLINSIILIDSPEFLSKHGDDLKKLIIQEQRLTNLNFWLKNIGNSNVQALCDICKNLEEKAGNLPSELISGLRALKNLALPTDNDCEFVELKQRHALLELFSLDGATTLANILNKVVETFEQPALYTAALLGPKGTRLTALLSPALSLLRAMLTVVAHCQGPHFRNLTSVPALLGSYTLLHAFPKCSPLYPLALHARGEAVTALLAFTQPCSEEALPKSLWTQMLAEVLKHVTVAPNTFLPGLELLSELLPLPLPFTAKEKISDEESARITSLHRLWGAHLHPLASAVHEMISLLGAASSPPLVTLVRKVCLQICDLEPSSALMVARAILEPTVASIKQDNVQGRCSMMSMRRLNLLTCVSCHPAPRAALLHLLRAGKTDDDSPLSLLCWALSKGEPSGVAQTSVSCLLCGLCDPSVANLGATPTPASRELLSGSVAALLACVLEGNTKYGAKPLLETLSVINTVLSASEYALYHAKITLDGKDRGCLVPLLTACTSNPELLAPTMKLVHACCDGESPIYLAKFLNWPQPEEQTTTPHPLNTLQTSSEAQEEVSALIKTMEEVQTADTPPVRDLVEPVIAAGEVLAAQFAQRPVVCSGEVPSLEIYSPEVSSTPQQERLDLAELSAAALPELNLVQELARLSHMHRAEETARHVKSEGVGRGDRGLRVRPYSNPMRGRGMYSIRGNVMAAPPARGDTFRSRPPNTSRPPSLHVDDFLALESAGQQPTGPTGYNKQTMRAKEMLVSRPRIRSRGVVSERGLRFPNPNMVYRRDNTRGISRGLPPNLGRGVMSESWSGGGGIRPQGDKMSWGGERGARRDMPRHPRTFSR